MHLLVLLILSTTTMLEEVVSTNGTSSTVYQGCDKEAWKWCEQSRCELGCRCRGKPVCKQVCTSEKCPSLKCVSPKLCTQSIIPPTSVSGEVSTVVPRIKSMLALSANIEQDCSLGTCDEMTALKMAGEKPCKALQVCMDGRCDRIVSNVQYTRQLSARSRLMQCTDTTSCDQVCVLGQCNLMFCDSATCKQRCTLNSRCKMVCGPRTKVCHQTCDLGSRCQLSCLGKDCRRNCTGASCQHLTTSPPPPPSTTTTKIATDNNNGKEGNSIMFERWKTTEAAMRTTESDQVKTTAKPTKTKFMTTVLKESLAPITPPTILDSTTPTATTSSTIKTGAKTDISSIGTSIINGNHSTDVSTKGVNPVFSFNTTLTEVDNETISTKTSSKTTSLTTSVQQKTTTIPPPSQTTTTTTTTSTRSPVAVNTTNKTTDDTPSRGRNVSQSATTDASHLTYLYTDHKPVQNDSSSSESERTTISITTSTSTATITKIPDITESAANQPETGSATIHTSTTKSRQTETNILATKTKTTVVVATVTTDGPLVVSNHITTSESLAKTVVGDTNHTINTSAIITTPTKSESTSTVTTDSPQRTYNKSVNKTSESKTTNSIVTLSNITTVTPLTTTDGIHTAATKTYVYDYRTSTKNRTNVSTSLPNGGNDDNRTSLFTSAADHSAACGFANRSYIRIAQCLLFCWLAIIYFVQ